MTISSLLNMKSYSWLSDILGLSIYPERSLTLLELHFAVFIA